ncbi:MAG TPA: DNA gyrase subunit A [Bacteroidetes bacterium]|nr:DNA gyrase subunit A [Ignavibacteria bacterium]HCA43000.1 DNA gyrase subunit A [Bacteroidota bacterium]HCN37046.1 DNA gyrase subunit A [Bacteroidota bacterium]
MLNEKIIPVNIEDEMKSSYIDYSMSVIVSRALPDVKDGLKPVHRRVLYGMNELGLAPNRPYKKSARIVGEVLGKYHPHGDKAVYDTMVRMVQDFSLRYPLVDGQGNFGSIDGDSPAAMRYTEARLAKISETLLRDLDKNTVDFSPNFDDTLKEPSVLPSVIPNLLVNGSNGIAVGMATNIPPHNLTEVINGISFLIKNPTADIKKLMKYVSAPDFPTGGIIYGYDPVIEAYNTGRGKINLRAVASIETEKNGKQSIIVSQLPYQVNKITLIETIANLARDKKIEDIASVNDESDRDGMRIVIGLKRDANAHVVMNNLYKHTQMSVTFGIIMLALVDGVPKILNLKQMMEHFINHRLDVIIRRSKFELEAAEKRAHILEGYIIALDNIDEVIKVIKKSKDTPSASEALQKKFKLSEIQAKAILDMRLQRLTGLERKKIEDEYKEILKTIERLKRILASDDLRREIVIEELNEIKQKFGDERRTEVIYDAKKMSDEDMLKELVKEEDVVITITNKGFIKRIPVTSYKAQGKGGKGITAASTGSADEDFIEHMFIGSTHQYIMFFTDKGKCYWLKVYDIPEGSRTSRGKSILSLIEKEKDEKVNAFVIVKDFTEELFVTMVTRNGVIKKSKLVDYSNIRRNGIIAINLNKGDELVDVRITTGNQELLIGTHDGQAIRFNESAVREMGRTATGVRGINLAKNDFVIGLVAVKRASASILVVTDKGFGKRSNLDDYRVTNRGGKGVKTVKTSEKNGKLLSIKEVNDSDDLMIITSKGILIRIHMKDIRVMGRNAQGVRLIRIKEGDTISAVANVIEEGKSDQEKMF